MVDGGGGADVGNGPFRFVLFLSIGFGFDESMMGSPKSNSGGQLMLMVDILARVWTLIFFL